jgi:AcrR family transcriptional regulator
MTEKSYHHGNLRQALLEAACIHLREENIDALSLRALARDIGVSQTAPYRHFDSRNALFAAIATWGFQILTEELESSLARVTGSAVESMTEMGLGYLRFSQQHSEKYQLLFDSSLVEFDEYPALQMASADCFDLMLTVISQGKSEGVFQSRPDEELAARIWSGLHGMASLLQISRQRETFRERPVGKALAYLADDSKSAITALLRSILK